MTGEGARGFGAYDRGATADRLPGPGAYDCGRSYGYAAYDSGRSYGAAYDSGERPVLRAVGEQLRHVLREVYDLVPIRPAPGHGVPVPAAPERGAHGV